MNVKIASNLFVSLVGMSGQTKRQGDYFETILLFSLA